MELREKFLKAGILYDELDHEMIELIDILNFKLNLKTKYSCFGHKELDYFYIMFHEDVDFERIEKLAEKVAEKIHGSYLSFKYYVRQSSHGVSKNWLCEMNGRGSVETRYKILNQLIDVLLKEIAMK